MKVVVNSSLCEGYGKCTRVAPDLFTLDEDGIAHVTMNGDLSPGQTERAQSAANLCPVNAISLVVKATESVAVASSEGGEKPHGSPLVAARLTQPFEKHVFVCTSGAYCPMLDGNSKEIHKAFKEEVAKAGLKGKVRVNNSGCLDQCGHGPTVVVYPEGVWYSHLDLEDVPVIVEEHLRNGRPVERLQYHPPTAGANKLSRNDEERRIAGQIDGCRPDWAIIPYDDPSVGKAKREE